MAAGEAGPCAIARPSARAEESGSWREEAEETRSRREEAEEARSRPGVEIWGALAAARAVAAASL